MNADFRLVMLMTIRRGLARRYPRLIGFAFLVAGLTCYRSWENRVILGRWSPTFFALLLTAWAGLFFLAWLSRGAASRHLPPSRAGVLFDVGVLGWGVAYFVAALDDPAAGGRLVSGNFFGSVAPLAIVTEWIAMALGALALGFAVAPRIRGRLTGPMVSLGTLLTLALVGEGVIRGLSLAAPQTQGFPTYRTELWRRRYVTLNREGFRDRDHASRAAPGTRRLLVVGDSFTFGSGVESMEERFGERLRDLLSAATGVPWESVNASLEDSHTLDEFEYLERGLTYGPDLVLLVYVFNDIDYLLPITSRSSLVSAPRGIFDRLRPGRLLFLNSYLFQQLYVEGRAVYFDRQRDRMAASSPYDNDRQLAEHLKDLGRFVECARSGSASAEIIPFDPKVVLHKAYLLRYERFVELSRRAGLPVLSLATAFDSYRFEDLIVNRLDSHPNALANRIAAEVVGAMLVEELGNPSARQVPQGEAAE